MTSSELIEWRTTARLTQGELAGLLGVSANTISRWEIGARAIPALLELALGGLMAEAARSAIASARQAPGLLAHGVDSPNQQ